MTFDAQLNELVELVLYEEITAGEYYRRAQSLGLSLSAAFHVVFNNSLNDEPNDEEVLNGLVEHCGSIGEAESIIRENREFVDFSISDFLTAKAAARSLDEAVAGGAPWERILSLLDSPELQNPDTWIAHLARIIPLSDALDAVALAACSQRAQMTATLALKRFSPSEAFEQLHASAYSVETCRDALQTHWGVSWPSTPVPEFALFELRAATFAASGRSVAGLIPGSPAGHEHWLPILRQHGLKASAAILHFLEGDSSLSLPQVASRLLAAGYQGEILAGFLENGLGTAPSLRLLGDSGWHLDKMVAALIDNDRLLPDVRNHLIDLGLKPSAIEDVCLRHFPKDLVSLVISGR